MIFFCYNEKYDGIFKSQVIEVLKNYNELGFNIKLISFISLASFFKERKKIKNEYNLSLVVPMIPFLKFWYLNKYFLRFFVKNSNFIIARGIFATNLAIFSRSDNCKVIYDGRGAINAEQKEYGVYNDTEMEDKIFEIEKNAVLNSSYRIAVTTKLIEYWGKNYEYKDKNHIVIPSCTKYIFEDFFFKNKLKSTEEIIIIFSGSSSKWHSFKIMSSHFEKFLNFSSKIKIIILSKKNDYITELIKKYPGRIIHDWVEPHKITNLLLTADYGYIYRLQSDTNYVASPVKIAEYLSCGLKLLISDNLGDYSSLVKNKSLGYNLDDDSFNFSLLKKVSISEKIRISSFAKKNLCLSSEKISKKYINLINENSLNK